MKVIFGVILWVLGATAWAQSGLSLVTSASLGNGVFSYTFEGGNEDYVWGIGESPFFAPKSSWIVIQSYGVVEVQNPPGWKASVTNDMIEWEHTNGLAYLDAPVTFTVRSSLPDVAEYRAPYPQDPNSPFGVIIGLVFRRQDHVYVTGGTQFFNYVGPALPKLVVETRGEKLLLTWPTNAFGFGLERAESTLSGVSWSAVTATPQIVGSNNVVIVDVIDAVGLFRLRRP